MSSKPEKRVRTENSMGPRGFGKTLKCNKNQSNEANELLLFVLLLPVSLKYPVSSV